MATLTNQDFIWIQQWINVHPTAKSALKSKHFSKTIWENGFQTLETFMVGAWNATPATSIKTSIETGVGESLTNPQAFAVYDAWNAWKIYTRGSG